jgi:hypothetical protein
MKSKLNIYAIVALLALAVTAAAADISGKWIVTVDNVDVEMVFKPDGNTLTGTIYNPLSGETKIKEGKIDGDKFSFIAIRKLGRNDTRIVWKGLLDGDVIRLTRVFPGGGTTQVIGLRPKAASPSQAK